MEQVRESRGRSGSAADDRSSTTPSIRAPTSAVSGASGGRTLPQARPAAGRSFAGHGVGDIGMSGTPGYLDKVVTAKYAQLPLAEGEDEATKVMCEYVWITRAGVAGASNPGQMMRSKTRVLDFAPETVADVPPWSSDGLSANQGTAEERLSYRVEVILQPAFMIDDPFRGRPNKIVLCEANLHDGRPTPSNMRAELRRLAAHPASAAEDCWIGFEQEQAVFEADKKHPLGWPPYGVPEAQLLYTNYCGIGGDATGREILESHLKCCLFSGLHVVGINLEVLVGSMEYQLAPLSPLEAADEAWMCRYIMARVVEEYGLHLSFDPKPVANADGCAFHSNVSLASTRTKGTGWAAIERCMALLSATHKEHLSVYGPGLERRLVGRDEYSSMDIFTWGVGDRSASVRIPFESAREGRGYFEDRRPGANADPYQVATRSLQTLVVGPADPNEDSGGKLAAVLAHLKSPSQAGASQPGASQPGASQPGASPTTAAARSAMGTGDSSRAQLAAAEALGRQAAEMGSAEQAAAKQRDAQIAQSELEPGHVPLPNAQAEPIPGQPSQPSFGVTEAAQKPAQGASSEGQASPTVRQVLARSRAALKSSLDETPSQRDQHRAQSSLSKSPETEGGGQQGGGEGGLRRVLSKSLDEVLDDSRRRLASASEGAEGHP